VTFEGEPRQYRVSLEPAGGNIQIRVLDSAIELWAEPVPVDDVARSVVRAFDRVARELGDEAYEAQWRRPFPHRELETLRATWRSL
jgi:hypothetical protein